MENIKNWFIQRYSELHEDLALIEYEIDELIKNKGDLLDNDSKLEDLKNRATEKISQLNYTREKERRIFNYGTT